MSSSSDPSEDRIAGRQPLGPLQRVAGPAADHVARGEYRDELQPLGLARHAKRHDPQVKLVGAQSGADLGQVAIALLEVHVRVLVLEGGNDPADHRIHEEGHAAHPHKAASPAQQALHGLGRAAAFGQDPAAVRGKLHPQRRRLQRPPVADEQRLADPRLKLRQRPRQRWLRQPQRQRALADAAGIDNGGQLDQMRFAQFHNRMIY